LEFLRNKNQLKKSPNLEFVVGKHCSLGPMVMIGMIGFATKKISSNENFGGVCKI
jgi:hypothetical protein